MPRTELFAIVDYINGHFTDEIRLNDLASQFGFTPSCLSRLLQKETGLNFTFYLRAKRLDLAKELLERMSVTEACFEVGFESLSHFSRMFKKRFGVNPSVYRKQLFGTRLRGLLLSDTQLDRRRLGQPVVSLVEQYHQRVIEILNAIQVREMDKILDIADRCGSKLKSGHKIVTVSYDSEGFQLETFPGGPHGSLGPGAQRQWYPIRKSYDPNGQLISIITPDFSFLPELNEGDLLLTAVPFPGIEGIAKRDNEVVGLASPFFRNRSSPDARLVTAPNDRFLEESVSRVIYSHLPAEDGLVAVPEIPMVPFAPGSSVAHMFIRSILLAGMAERLAKPKPKAAGPALAVMGRLKVLSEQACLIKDIGTQMAERVIAGGRLYLGGWGKVLNEFTWRASGLMGLRPLGSSPTTEKDVALIDASSGFDPAAETIAPVLRDRGACVVVVSDGRGKKPVLSLCDSALNLKDRLSGQPGMPGNDNEQSWPHLPDARILSSVLLWMLLTSYLQEMIIRGHVPFVFRGFHLAGGNKYNEAVYPLFLDRGY